MLLPRAEGEVVGGGVDTETADQDDFGPRILVAVWLVGVLSGIALGLRLYCKVKRSRQAWYDDYILMAAWVSFLSSPAMF